MTTLALGTDGGVRRAMGADPNALAWQTRNVNFSWHAGIHW